MTTPNAPTSPDDQLELALAKLSIPFPWVSRTGDLTNGLAMSQPKICIKCSTRECKDLYAAEITLEVRHEVCPKGLSLLIFNFPFGRIVTNGVLENSLNTECTPYLKKRLRSQKVTYKSAETWWSNTKSLDKFIVPMLEARINESIQSFHDIGTAVQLVTSRARSIIRKLSGETDEEKIENAEPDMKALFKSVLLLGRHLEMSSIVANPEAASFGQKHPTPIYKVFDLICKLYQEIAHARGKHIVLNGTSHKKPLTYNSFETLALVLLDNAVKYCNKGESVTVQVNDVEDGVKVVVENPGFVVPSECQNLIFEKGFRTPRAKQQQSAGRGFGLYIAKTIAQAHGFTVEYRALQGGRTSDSSIGINSFRFKILD